MSASAGEIIAKLGIQTSIKSDMALAGAELRSGLAGMSSSTGAAFAGIATGVAYAGAAVGVAAGVIGVKGVIAFRDFEQSVTNAASVLGLTGEAFNAAKQNIAAVSQELGQKTAFSSAQAADAFYNLASAGYDVSKMTASDLLPMLNLAAGTQYDLAATTAVTSSTLAQFGLGFESAGRVTDVFAKAIGSTQANMEKLSVSMNYAGPAMAGVNGSLEQTTAILGVLYNNGMSAEMAGTAVRTAIASLLDPSADATAALTELGLTPDQVNPELHSMTEIISLLGSKGLTMGQAIQIAGREGANGLLTLTQNSDQVNQLTKDLEAAGGAAETMAGQQLDTLAGSLDNLYGSLENILINVGGALAPAIRGIAGSITEAAPAIQAALLHIVGFFMELGSRLAPALSLIQTIGSQVFGIFSNIFKSISGSSGGLAQGIASLVTRTLDAIRIVIDRVGPIVQGAIIGVIQFVKTLISSLGPTWQSLKSMAGSLGAVFQAFFKDVAGPSAQGAATSLAGVVNKIMGIVAGLVARLSAYIVQAAPTIRAAFSRLMDGVRWFIALLPPLWASIKEKWAELGTLFNGVIEKLRPTWTRIQTFFSELPDKLQPVIERLTPIWERIKAIWDQLPAIFNSAMERLAPVWAALKTIFNNLVLNFNDFVSQLGPTWENLRSIWDSLGTIFETVWATLKPIWDQIKEAWSGFISSFAGPDTARAPGLAGLLATGLNLLSSAIARLLKWVAEHPKISEFATTVASMAARVLIALPPVVSAIIDFAGKVGTWLGNAVDTVTETYNTWRERWDSFKLAVDNVVGPIITTLEGWYNTVSTVLSNVATWLTETYNTWKERWDSFKTAVDSAVGPIITTLEGWYNTLSTTLSNVTTAVTTFLSDWDGSWTGLETSITTAKDNVLRKLGEWYDGLVTKFDEVKRKIKEFLGDWSTLWGGVESATADSASGGETSSGGLLSRVWEGLKSAFETLKEELGKKYTEIKDAASLFIGEFTKLWDGLVAGIGTIRTGIETALDLIRTGIETITAGILTVIDTFNTNWGIAWAAIVTATDTAGANLNLALTAISNTVLLKTGEILFSVDEFNNEWRTAWALTVTITNTAGANLNTALTTLRTNVVNALNQIVAAVNTFAANVGTAFNSALAAIQAAAYSITQALARMASDAANAMAAFVGNIRNGLAQGLDAINSQQSAYYAAGKALTDSQAAGMSAGGKNTTKALTTTNNKNSKQLPHSPAKEGPFKKLPNWDAVFIDPLRAGIARMSEARAALVGQLAGLKGVMSGSLKSPLLNITGDLAGFTRALHAALDSPAKQAGSTTGGTTSTGGTWSKTTTQNGTTTTTGGQMTQAQAQALLAKMEKLIQAQAPTINIKDVKLDSSYNFDKLMGEIDQYQSKQRRQRGTFT